MSNVVTLSRYTPLERDDTVPWLEALIQEAPDPVAGPWTTIDTIDLSQLPGGLDTDPANPITRDLTTSNATLQEGWYRVIWQDGGGNTSSATAPIQNTSDLAEGNRPSVAEVASLLRARTKVLGGKEVGTFNTHTRPTADEVEDIIDQAVDEVSGKVQDVDQTLPYGQTMGPGSAYERRCRRAVALQAAILIELSYFPEQIKTGQSPVATYQALYDSRIKALIAEGEHGGQQEGMGDGGSGGGDAPADAAWAFPDAAPGALIGWNSRW